MPTNERCLIYGRLEQEGYELCHLIDHLDEDGTYLRCNQTDSRHANLAEAVSAAYRTFPNKVALILEDGHYYWLGTDPMPDEEHMVEFPSRPR